jgi:hypothetical protein
MPWRCMGSGVIAAPFLTAALGGEWSASSPCCLPLGKQLLIHTGQESRWAPNRCGSVTGEKNLTLAWDWICAIQPIAHRFTCWAVIPLKPFLNILYVHVYVHVCGGRDYTLHILLCEVKSWLISNEHSAWPLSRWIHGPVPCSTYWYTWR